MRRHEIHRFPTSCTESSTFGSWNREGEETRTSAETLYSQPITALTSLLDLEYGTIFGDESGLVRHILDRALIGPLTTSTCA